MKYIVRPVPSTKPAQPSTISASAATVTGLGPSRLIPSPAMAKPSTMPTGNVAISAPISAGVAEVVSAISGTTGAMTL